VVETVRQRSPDLECSSRTRERNPITEASSGCAARKLTVVGGISHGGHSSGLPRDMRQVGGHLWNGQQLSTAVNATSPLSRAKALSASRTQERKSTSSSITGFATRTAGKGSLGSASKTVVRRRAS
jgi:hypothetical protein